MPPRKKRKTVLEGYLSAEDVRKMDMSNEVLKEYWSRVKNNLFILGSDKEIFFLNNEFKKIAKKYEGRHIRITIEEVPYVPPEEEGLPDMDTEYEGFEKFKKQMFTIFRIS